MQETESMCGYNVKLLVNTEGLTLEILFTYNWGRTTAQFSPFPTKMENQPPHLSRCIPVKMRKFQGTQLLRKQYT